MEDNPGTYSLGANTYSVSYTLHQKTRQKIISSLLSSSTTFANTFVLLQGGKSVCRHDTDHEELFRQESYFHYAFGVKEPDCFGAIDVTKNEAILFIPRLPPSYATWMGSIKSTTHFQKLYLVNKCYYTDEIETVLKDLGCTKILTLHGQNTDSGEFHTGAHFPEIEQFEIDKTTLFPKIQYCRVIKLKEEIDVLRNAVKVSAAAHIQVMKSVSPGMMEYELESFFQHLVYSKGGCRHLAYTCICGSGINSSILHYGHAGAPNCRQIKDGDILMFDMGGEYYCYCADISRSFPANGKFTQQQREIYLSVYAAQQAVMDTMKAGVSWPEMHRLSLRVICEQLKKYEFLKGDVDKMMEKRIGSLFMPHGLGHLLGIDTHDVGGYPLGTSRSTDPSFKNLRFGGILEENMVITVEPGIYFIRSILEPAFIYEETSQFLNIEKIHHFLDFGGVRIEDDVVVLADGIDNLSVDCPRTIEEIEALMASK